jgi:hypothetical protein
MTNCNPFKTLLPQNIKLQNDMKFPPIDTHMYQHMVGKLVFFYQHPLGHSLRS